jgi:hypothetical protein
MAYENTKVPVAQSMSDIEKLLIAHGAKGMQWAKSWETREVNVRFVKETGGEMRTVSMTITIPDPPKPRTGEDYKTEYIRSEGYVKRPTAARLQRLVQAERQTYRALYWWLKSQFEAVDFGLLTFEDIFLSHFEWMVGGQRTTVGALIKPRLSDGSNLLMAPRDDVVEGEYE